MRHLSVMNHGVDWSDYMLCLLESWFYMIMELRLKNAKWLTSYEELMSNEMNLRLIKDMTYKV